MAKAQQSLLKNSSSIENIKDSLNAFGTSLRKANSTSSNIVKSLYKGNRDKKRAIVKQRELFQKRREAVQKREQEDIIEAGKVGSVYRRSSKIISGSTKGFLGRVMDFVGTIMVGWLVNNLPRIIKGAQDLIGRIQNLIGVLSSWVDGIGNFYLDFTAQLDGILGRNKNLGIDQDKELAGRCETELEGGVNKMLQNMEQMISDLLGFDLLKILGLKAEPGGLDSSQPPSAGSEAPGGVTYGDSGDSGDSGSSSGSGARGNFGPRTLALLDTLAMAEGTIGQQNSGYNTHFGFDQTEDLSAHPGIIKGTGKLRSDAFGRYQFLSPTWKSVGGAVKRGPYSGSGMDMSPANQDKAAVILINRRLGISSAGELEKLLEKEGLSSRIISRLSGEWASFPGNNYGQPTKKQSTLINFYNKKVRQKPTQPSRQTQTTGPAPRIDTSKRYKVGDDVSSTLGASARITSLKGSRESFRSKPHGGLDIACDPNLYISLRVDAEVVATQRGGGYGNLIDVWIPSVGIQLRFAHNTRILISSGKIPAGTSFATTGYTGNVRPKGPQGSHIHLEADSKRGGTTYGGSTSPAPYVSLIRLTNAKIEGKKSGAPESRTGSGGPSLESIPTQTGVAEKVTPERKGKTLTVPMPMGGGAQPSAPAPQGEGGGISMSLGGGNQLNSFVTKTLLKELEYV